MNERLIHPQDVTIMVKSMEELFAETNDVTPKMLAEGMSKKCGRNLTYQFASYLTVTFGFNTKSCHFRSKKLFVERYYVKDDELLNKIKLDLPNIEANCLASSKAPPSSELSFSRSKLEILSKPRYVI